MERFDYDFGYFVTDRVQPAMHFLESQQNLTNNIFFSINSQITGLWGIYIAATFTGAGFSLASAGGVSPVEATFAAAGFSIFAIGHYHLIRNAVTRLNAVRMKVLDVSAKSENPRLFRPDFETGKTAFDDILLIATHPTGPSASRSFGSTRTMAYCTGLTSFALAQSE